MAHSKTTFHSKSTASSRVVMSGEDAWHVLPDSLPAPVELLELPGGSNSRPSAAAAEAHAVGHPHVGKAIADQREFVFDPATQAVSAASGVWDQELVADQLAQWKLTKGQPHLKQLAAASPAGTSLVANLKHIAVTLAIWDMVWEVYLNPKWAQQRLRLYGAQDRALEQYFKKGIDQRRGRVVLVDEHRTSRVCSAVIGQQPLAPRKPPQAPCSSQAATQPAVSEPGPSTPPPAKRSNRTEAEQAAEPTQPTKGKGKAHGKAAKAKPAPQPGRWLDRDCSAALNMQRIGESRWHPLELCWWPDSFASQGQGVPWPGLQAGARQATAAAAAC
ncbi:hypothetical protein QJQ45_006236 [Haematococcus lacustris]|nr:hypothetical protein QJQ45_006236 [Haematococcus lacustris]